MTKDSNTLEHPPLGFFSQKSTQEAIKNFLPTLELNTDNPFTQERNRCIEIILNLMTTNPQMWDSGAMFSASWIGSQFLSDLRAQDPKSFELINSIFKHCYQFTLELDLCTQEELSKDLQGIFHFVKESLHEFDSESQKNIQWAGTHMPLTLFKGMYNNDVVRAVYNVQEARQEIESKLQHWKEDIEKKEKRVTELANILEEQKTAFNFVGLHQGFDKLWKQKRIEKWVNIAGATITGAAALFILGIKIYLYTITPPNALEAGAYFTLFASFSIVILMVYFFRIFLMNVKSAKSQLLQLDLRKALCAFISGYVKFKKGLGTKEPVGLALFEKIIFSGIVTNEEKLPTAFDGVEQLAQCIKSIKQ